jgi:hypothetical protein
MRVHALLSTYRRRRVVAAASALAVVAGVAGATSGSAAATSVLNTVTYLHGEISGGDALVLHAQVTYANRVNGLGITPSGSIHFSDDAGDDLGTVTLPQCVNTLCVASTTVSIDALSDGVGQLTADYSGDLLLKPSQGTMGFSPCVNGCYADSQSGAAYTSVSSDSSTGAVDAGFGGQGLPCGVNNGGPTGNVDAYNLDANKQISYQLQGAGAQAYHTLIAKTSHNEWFCYVSPDPFKGYYPNGTAGSFPESDAAYANFGWVPQIQGGAYDGQYVGLLGHCYPYSVLPPCISSWWNAQGEGSGSPWYLDVMIDTPPNDPHFGGLKVAAPKIGSSSTT